MVAQFIGYSQIPLFRKDFMPYVNSLSVAWTTVRR
jgi:hypothetical protein